MKEIERAQKEFGVLDRVPVGICVLRQDFSVVFWNSCLEDWTGIPRNSILGVNIGDHFPHLNTPRYNVRLRDIFAGGPPTIFSSQLHSHIIPSRLKNGNLRTQHMTVTPVRALDGEGFYSLLATQDVTDLTCRIQDYRSMRDQALEELRERKRVEEELRKAREDLEARVEECTSDYHSMNRSKRK